ncbi:MAG: CocE/NonD family hydrolase C-terminal non-catalytic domain-containing protein, partial [Actinomycetota bacterium]
KGIEPTPATDFEAVAVQDNFGRYRAETAYPSADTTLLNTSLRSGTYSDGTGGGIHSVSQPLPHDVWLAGEPRFSASVTTTVPRGNITVLTYDIDEAAGTRTLINRGTSLIRGVGAQQVDIQMYAQDWVVEEGHRIGVEVRGTNNFWVHVPTGQTVTVNDADIALPFLTADRTDFLDGESTPRLESHLAGNAADLGPIVTGNEVPFTLPAAIDTGAR